MLPTTEVAPPTPTSPSQMKSPLTETRRMAFANSKRFPFTAWLRLIC
ncbi:hypothetical protein ANCCAN_17159 [Ancylostoma caninum]|uniref:Uncharacterized protein n=1 Tax=Ancylostoma caninum TaxID=29170 RepID=A0A368G2Y7_ANCCA|nr:hypothetical protein ANCCAN_17159 [Ancylostoma caninum]